jgi:hypothetical protein
MKKPEPGPPGPNKDLWPRISGKKVVCCGNSYRSVKVNGHIYPGQISKIDACPFHLKNIGKGRSNGIFIRVSAG